MVADCRGALARRFEPDHRRDTRRGVCGVAVAPGAVIADRAPFGAGALAHRLELLGRRIAVICLPGGEQLARELGVMGGTGELVDDFAVPFEPEPSEAIEDGCRGLRGRALAVGVLDSLPLR